MLQPLFGKCATGGGFQIAFKFCRPLAVSKGNGGLDAPWTGLGCVWNVTGVVDFQTSSQILGKADVKSIRGRFTVENVNVEEFHRLLGWLAES